MDLVDPEVTRRKVDREIELWGENAASYRRRGWLLLGRDGNLVDVSFIAQLPLAGRTIPILAASVRIDYTNFDLWPPSVQFIDPASGDFAPPVKDATVPTAEGPRNLIVNAHPDNGRPFFCVVGTREYHFHDQHSGDDWLLHRANGAGGLAIICDRVWNSMVRNLVGLQVSLLTLPPEAGQGGQVQVQLVSGDIDALRAGGPVELQIGTQ
jgi:hypothetical protein